MDDDNKVYDLCTTEGGSGDMEQVHSTKGAPSRKGDAEGIKEKQCNPEGISKHLVNVSPQSSVDSTLVVIELCAGSAMLSAILKRDGFESIPVDFGGNRHRPHMHILSMDLRDASTWTFLQFAVVTRLVLHIHAGPPCGTCSRARGILLDDGTPGPQPLRDEFSPLGFSWLQGDDLERVRSANAVYLQLANFLRWCHNLGIGFSIENPTNSLLWFIPAYQMLLEFSHFVNFDACMHGSERLKRTSFLTNISELDALAVQCDASHSHKPWGMTEDNKFATSQEAAYPKELCEAISDCLKMRARSLGFEVDSLSLPQDAITRAAVQVQPRRNSLPALMSEFAYTQTVTTSDRPVLDSKNQLCEPFHNVPLKSKLVRKISKQGDSVSETCFTFGIYRDPITFVDEAKYLKHPFDTTCALPDYTLKALAMILEKGPLGVMKHRLLTLKKWQKWAVQLKEDEKRLHDSLHPNVAKVLQGKKLLLLEKVASELEWPDKDLYRQIRDGFKLTGNPEPSGIFQLDFKPALFDEEEFFRRTRYMKHALWSKIANQQEQDFTVPLWDITNLECSDKHWLHGPLSWEQLEEKYGGVWMPCRRFAVWQTDKWRPIDDLTENAVNSAYTVCEKIHLRALDETIWIAVALMRYMRETGSYSFSLSDGSKICGRVDPSWNSSGLDNKPYAKTVDLKSAYKQWAIAPSETCKAIISLKAPETGKVVGFECLTLPFGSVASVICFNRIARLYQRILQECAILAANYYDDFPVVDLGALTSNTDSSLRAISGLFGFTVSFDKEKPFSRTADMLGVTLDLTDDTLFSVKVSNKAARVGSMVSALDEIIQRRSVQPVAMPSLFGRLQFCEAQLLGRQGRLAISDLRMLERSKSKSVQLGESHLKAFHILLERLEKGRPRTIVASIPKTPVLVFTDGACEPEGDSFIGSVGGVLIYLENGSFHWRAFGGYVPKSVMDLWTDKGKKHLIGPVEMYAVCLARQVWSDYLRDRAIFFVDHGGVLASLISGSSRDEIWRELLLCLECSDSVEPCLSWFARVASASNIADGPSRGMWDVIQRFEYVRDFPKCVITGQDLKPT